MHSQFACRFALIAVVLPQHRGDEGFAELTNSFAVENPTLVHLAYKCVEFGSHGARSLTYEERRMASKLRPLRGWVNYPNRVQRNAVSSPVWEAMEIFHNCTKDGH